MISLWSHRRSIRRNGRRRWHLKEKTFKEIASVIISWFVDIGRRVGGEICDSRAKLLVLIRQEKYFSHRWNNVEKMQEEKSTVNRKINFICHLVVELLMVNGIFWQIINHKNGKFADAQTMKLPHKVFCDLFSLVLSRGSSAECLIIFYFSDPRSNLRRAKQKNIHRMKKFRQLKYWNSRRFFSLLLAPRSIFVVAFILVEAN